MKFLALISGGKDSFYNIHHCLTQGHELVALGNLYPDSQQDEIDSFMFQTVGHDIIDYYSECLDVPLYRQAIKGSSKNQNLEYEKTEEDEIEDLHCLIQKVVQNHPDIEGISCGAILSHYQRTRVENICDRFGLTSLAFLWQRGQDQLMREMCESKLDARIIKVAAIGLTTKHLGKSITQLYPHLVKLNQMYEVHICGEGGEFETIVLDSKFFKKKLIMTDEKIIESGGDVSYLKFKVDIVEKDELEFMPVTVPNLLLPEMEDIVQECEASPSLYLEPSITNSYAVEPYVTQIGNSIYVSNLTNSCDTATQQLSNIFDDLESKLAEYNVTFNDIQHVTLLLRNMNKFSDCNKIYLSKFSHCFLPPSRVCIETNLSEPYQVQLSCKIIAKEFNIKKGIHIRSRSYWAPQNIGPYSQARVEEQLDFNFATISGQIPLVPQSMELLNEEVRCTALTIQHFDRIKRLINVEGISSVLCFVTQINMKLVQSIWSAYCDDQQVGTKEKLVILQVNKLPKNAIIEMGGETYKALSFDDDDKEDDRLNHIIESIKEEFPQSSFIRFNTTANFTIFSDSPQKVDKLCSLGFAKVYCTPENFMKLSVNAEFMPVMGIYDHNLNSHKYSISLTIKA